MPNEKLPSIDEIAAQVTKGPAGEATAPEINVNEAKSTDGVEATLTAPEKEAPKKDPMAAKFAALARREKEARARAEEADRLASDNARMKQEIELRAKQIEDRENAIKAAKKPFEVLKAHGLTYEDVTAEALGEYKAPAQDPMDLKLSEKLSPIEAENRQLKDTLTQMQQTLADIQSERVQMHQQRYISEINQISSEAGHDLILKIGQEAYTLVQLVQQDYQQKHGKNLSLHDACAKVEEYYDRTVSGLLETPKLKSRFAPPSSPPAPSKQSIPKKEVSERPNTLTQGLTQGSRAKSVDVDKLPRHEALAYLATQLRFKD